MKSVPNPDPAVNVPEPLFRFTFAIGDADLVCHPPRIIEGAVSADIGSCFAAWLYWSNIDATAAVEAALLWLATCSPDDLVGIMKARQNALVRAALANDSATGRRPRRQHTLILRGAPGTASRS